MTPTKLNPSARRTATFRAASSSETPQAVDQIDEAPVTPVVLRDKDDEDSRSRRPVPKKRAMSGGKGAQQQELQQKVLEMARAIMDQKAAAAEQHDDDNEAEAEPDAKKHKVGPLAAEGEPNDKKQNKVQEADGADPPNSEIEALLAGQCPW